MPCCCCSHSFGSPWVVSHAHVPVAAFGFADYLIIHWCPLLVCCISKDRQQVGAGGVKLYRQEFCTSRIPHGLRILCFVDMQRVLAAAGMIIRPQVSCRWLAIGNVHPLLSTCTHSGRHQSVQ